MKPKTNFLIWLLLAFNVATGQDSRLAEAQNLVIKYIADHRLKDVHNAYVDENRVIHIFVFQDFSSLLKAFPTTATEKNRFQVHLLVDEEIKDLYTLDYVGTYNPVFTFDNSGMSFGSRGASKMVMVDFAVAGPYTSTVQLQLKRKTGRDDDTGKVVAAPITINISKTIYGSIGYGLVYSSLLNPSNIQAVPRPGGDTTLIADDVGGRGLSTIMATFYPWGRNNLLLPDWSFHDRFGIVVGTSVGSKSPTLENFLLGGQYDFSIGGSVIAGFHYGKRQRIQGVDYKQFTFGESRFTGNLASQKFTSWDFGFFLGVQVDNRIFSQLFKKD